MMDTSLIKKFTEIVPMPFGTFISYYIILNMVFNMSTIWNIIVAIILCLITVISYYLKCSYKNLELTKKQGKSLCKSINDLICNNEVDKALKKVKSNKKTCRNGFFLVEITLDEQQKEISFCVKNKRTDKLIYELDVLCYEI